ncbi:alkaline phosphatase D family protein [Pelomonas parva]|uniref:Alkaline phosphatase D family protein n=1 Tax=Pelomonas parva TaxID=3299032 RepID=A0ABW7F283_9BURK
MRIAHTSCFSATVFREQPVWRHILAARPDRLVLTGDAIYIDELTSPLHPKQLSEYEFVELVAEKYRRQLGQPDFAALIAQVPTVAIWDDHDFLWNESYEEKAITRKVYAGLIRASRALFNAFCAHLEGRAPFPASNSDARFWQAGEPAPGYRQVVLDPPGQAPLRLHLTDGRSWRLRRALLGEAQRRQIQEAIEGAPPDTVHLLASGSVLEAHKGDCWANFEDLAWLKSLAAVHRIACLSGDIHNVDFQAIDTGPWRLFDFTASGAAIRKAIWVGSTCQNYGLVDIDAQNLTASWFEFGQPSPLAPVSIDRATWR